MREVAIRKGAARQVIERPPLSASGQRTNAISAKKISQDGVTRWTPKKMAQPKKSSRGVNNMTMVRVHIVKAKMIDFGVTILRRLSSRILGDDRKKESIATNLAIDSANGVAILLTTPV